MKVDKFDLKIILLLLENSMRPSSEIAKAIGRSRQFVDYRIKRMEEKKVIIKYITALKTKMLGYRGYRILAYGRPVRKFPKVFGIGYIGRFRDGLDISIISKDTLNIQYLVNWLKDQGFDLDLMIKGKTIIPFNFLGVSIKNLPENKSLRISIPEKEVFRIIELMNRSRSIIEIARKLRRPVSAVRRLIKSLEGKEIRGYSLLFDEKAFEYKRVVIFVNSKKPKKFPRNLKVNLLEKLSGKYDFRIEFLYKDEGELDNLLDEIDPHTKEVKILEIERIY